MASPTIITCAVTGSITSTAQHPGIPSTPAGIAAAAVDAARVGASVVHIHVRDPKTGAPSMDVELYREVMERIQASGADLVINLTTGPGARYIPAPEDPRVMDERTNLLPPVGRVRHIQPPLPEPASLALTVLWSGSPVMTHSPTSDSALP